MTFKVGDLVVCVTKDHEFPLTLGETYKIVAIEGNFIRVRADDGRLLGYLPHRLQAMILYRHSEEYEEVMAAQDAMESL